MLAQDDDQALSVIQELPGRPGVALVQLRNVGCGCYSGTVRRA